MNAEARPNGLIKVNSEVGGATANPVIDGCLIRMFNKKIPEIVFVMNKDVFICC
jgi:hypothetical protein